MDPFLAYQWTLVCLSAIGFWTMQRFLSKISRLPEIWTALLAYAFAFGNALYLKAGHPQLYSIYWMPVVAICALKAAQASHRRCSIIWASLCGCLVGLILFSTYYVGWFILFTGALFLVALVLVSATRQRLLLWRHELSVGWPQIAAFGLSVAISLIPFGVIYLPVLHSIGGRKYSESMLFAARPGDMINAGRNNYVWGAGLRRVLSNSPRLVNSEVSLSLTPTILILTLIAILMIWIARWRTGRLAAQQLVNIASAVGAVIVASVLLPVKFGIGSLWRIPWLLAPGAVGIRAIDRLEIIVGFWVCVLLALALAYEQQSTQLRSSNTRRLRTTIVLALLVFVAFEQINLDENSTVHRQRELQFIDKIPQPLATCRSFYVTESASPLDVFYVQSIDAMLISQHFRIPTINGYSGQFPPGYGSLVYPTDANYVPSVHAWAVAHSITAGLCSLDLSTQTWALSEFDHTP